MGTLKSNLLKISQLNGKTRGGRIIGLYLLLLGSVQNVAPKSLYSSSLLNSTDIFTEKTQEATSTATSRAPWKHDIIKLDLFNSYHGPEYVWEVKKDENEAKKFTIGQTSKGFKIAIHLKYCNFGEDEYIEIKTPGNVTAIWNCTQITTTPVKHFLDNYTSKEIHASNEEPHIAYEAIDNLDEVSITPYFTFEGNEINKLKQRGKAVIIANLYKDEVSGCSDDFFDCQLSPCPTTCCSDLQQGPKSPSRNFNQRSTLAFSSNMLTSAFWSRKGSHTSRCIPKSLKCNQRPNCGKHGTHPNKDEIKEICFPEKFCECQSVCLTWNYVLTSLAIAILFIITPTAIVFALFHRRNVALERARLIRLAHMRMADLRGEFTMDDPANDRPPSYDEVYDIKEPPPCFCKAIAMQKEYDLRQQQQERNSADDTSANEEMGDAVEETSPKNERIEFQNLGFQCSCVSLNQRDEGEETARDIPPTYSELNRRRNEGDTQVNRQTEEDSPQGTENHTVQQPVVSELPTFKDVDLDKEDNV